VEKEAVEIIHSSFRSFAMRWCRLSSRCFPSAIMVNDRLAAVAVVRTFQANWRFRLNAAVHTIPASEWGACSFRLELVHATRIEKPASSLNDRTL
jgi:hypothetical protein